ncbi:alpha/beta hydrolase [Aspergillus stella-maris]|uniref:alpha/beta hydrolase n=1 Tax=Aspergillus stella-maris TaxID=1810926 RepID=UPI003CCD9B34
MLLGFLALTPLATAYPSSPSKIHWTGPCPAPNQTAPMTCGTLTVPLDYTDKTSNKTITLDIAKISGPAKQPGGKSVLYNPGGPGEDSLKSMVNTGGELQAILGDEVDIVTFNTRGLGNTIPFSCYDTDTLRAAALESPLLTNTSDTAPATVWASASNLAGSCYAKLNQTGDLYGTAFIARDMMQIVDALGEDGLLHYWGFSYGTLLGATVAAMFPDRMGNVVLDGVLNPYQYYNGYDEEQLKDADLVFSGICSACYDAPGPLCPLQTLAPNRAALETLLYSTLDTLKYHPIPLGESFKMDYETLKGEIFTALYQTSSWPGLAETLFWVVTEDIRSLYAAAVKSAATTDFPNESNQGIKCGDKTIRTPDFDDFEPIMELAHKASRIIGDVNTHINMQCAQWHMSAKERYNGDFHVKTRTPILLIGNTYDPATPFQSAQNVSEAFEGSVLLRNDGYGHTSLGQPSVCTGMAVRDYFLNNKLPEGGKVCEPSVQPFHIVNDTAVFQKRQLESGGEANMLRAMMSLGGKMAL